MHANYVYVCTFRIIFFLANAQYQMIRCNANISQYVALYIIHSYGRLRQLDPEYAASLDRNDWYRLKRALDICTMSGRYVCVNVCVCVCDFPLLSNPLGQ